MRDDGKRLVEPATVDHDWRELIRAADCAGRWAAAELARRCSAWELGRTGRVWVRVEPSASPVADWLHRHGHGRASESGTGVDVAIATTAADLGAVPDAEFKARSVLVRRAYACAYVTVLAEEAGVSARLVTVSRTSGPVEDPAAGGAATAAASGSVTTRAATGDVSAPAS